jgi:hypothetical protein
VISEDLRVGRRTIGRRGAFAAFVIMLAATAAACSTTNMPTVPTQPAVVIPPGPPVAVDIAALPGRWGLASYRDEKDRARTEAEARRACGNPYVIASGPQGGVMMYLADQTQPSELFVKMTPDGRSFIGPRGAPGMIQDRVVMYFQNGVLIADWLDPSARERYGTMLFVRCG